MQGNRSLICAALAACALALGGCASTGASFGVGLGGGPVSVGVGVGGYPGMPDPRWGPYGPYGPYGPFGSQVPGPAPVTAQQGVPVLQPRAPVSNEVPSPQPGHEPGRPY